MNKLSPNAKHELIVQNFHVYCQQLLDSGRRFPTNQLGAVNVSNVAEMCGCKRGAFEKRGSYLNTLLHQKVADIGLEVPTNSVSLERTPNHASGIKGSPDLSRALARATAEIEKQREIIEKLEQEVSRYELARQEAQLSMESMLDDGRRRFTWE
ncbi:hypothetical protein [Alteromonas lipotrueiana]|uniref:hypothetical protein n=1 Tax=Alteromonas lipotrueiana TaxID=2803815 RepID=UPI001C44F47B|nr:hypothetical protein [Alteromonas lipotrueiana]